MSTQIDLSYETTDAIEEFTVESSSSMVGSILIHNGRLILDSASSAIYLTISPAVGDSQGSRINIIHG